MKKINVKTSFNVNLELDAETLSKRILAFIIDFIVIIAYLFLMMRVLGLVQLDSYRSLDADRINWGIQSILLLPVMLYTLISEVVSGGRTLGKAAMGIKVVKISGYQPTFVDFFIRWIFRAVEIYSFLIMGIIFNTDWVAGLSILLFGFIAVFIIAMNKKGQRLGDIIAGTAVTIQKQVQHIDITILKEINENYVPKIPQVIRLSDNDMRIIKDTYLNSKKIDDYDTIAKLRHKIETVLHIKNDMLDAEFFDTVLKDYNYYTQNG